MKKASTGLLIFLVTWGFSAAADIIGAGDSLRTPIDNGWSAPQTDFQAGIYRFPKNGEIEPNAVIVEGDPEENSGGVIFATSKGEAVQAKQIASGEILLTYHLPQNEIGKISNQLIVSRAEFESLKMNFITDASADKLYKYESGYTNIKYASGGGQSYVRARKHKMSYRGSKKAHYRSKTGGIYATIIDANGRVEGHDHNCVYVVANLIHMDRATSGAKYANWLAGTGKYHFVSLSTRTVGEVCSWVGGGYGGHTAVFDGKCFVPTYKAAGICGDPGPHYRMYRCVAKN